MVEVPPPLPPLPHGVVQRIGTTDGSPILLRDVRELLKGPFASWQPAHVGRSEPVVPFGVQAKQLHTVSIYYQKTVQKLTTFATLKPSRHNLILIILPYDRASGLISVIVFWIFWSPIRFEIQENALSVCQYPVVGPASSLQIVCLWRQLLLAFTFPNSLRVSTELFNWLLWPARSSWSTAVLKSGGSEACQGATGTCLLRSPQKCLLLQSVLTYQKNRSKCLHLRCHSSHLLPHPSPQVLGDLCASCRLVYER